MPDPVLKVAFCVALCVGITVVLAPVLADEATLVEDMFQLVVGASGTGVVKV